VAGYKAKDTAKWLIHAPRLKPLDVDAVIEYARANVPKDLYNDALLARRILSDETLWKPSSTTMEVPKSRVHRRVAQAMVSNGILVEMEKGNAFNNNSLQIDNKECPQPKAWGLLSTKPEPHKDPPRLRVISDMLWSNWALDDMVHTQFSTQRTLDGMFRRSFGATFDFSGWYYALPVRNGVENYLVVRSGNSLYKHVRAPMGHKWMVFAAHSLTKVIAYTPRVDFDVIIDNVLLASNDEVALKQESDAFVARAKSFGATLGEASGPQRNVTYRGMVVHMGNDVTVKAPWASKCALRITYVLSKDPTAAQVYSLGGMLAWLRGVIPLDVLEDYHWWKDVAKAANASPNKRIRLRSESKTALQQLKMVLTEVPLPTRTLNAPHKPRAVIATDAALTKPLGRWGAIIVTTRITAMGGLFPIALCQVASIADLEMAAVLMAIELSKGLDGKEIMLYTDNQTVQRVLTKRRSCAYRLHMFCKRIHASVRSKGSRLAAAVWIPSTENPADGISRGRNLTDKDVAQTLSLSHKFGVVPEGIDLNREFKKIEPAICHSILLKAFC